MWRRPVLGGDEDNRIICTSSWKMPLGIRLHVPGADRLTQAEAETARGWVDAIQSLPWVEVGKGDFDVVLHPSKLQIEDLWQIAKGSVNMLCLHFGAGLLDLGRELNTRCRCVWWAGCSWDALQGGEPRHRIVCSNLGLPTRERVAKVINCTRSPRYEAELP